MSVYFEERKDGSKAWFYDFSHNGVRYRKVAGRTRTEAERVQAKVRTQVFNEEYQLTNQKRDPYLAAFADTYLLHRQHMSSVKRDKLSVKHLKSFFKKQTLGSITGNDVRLYINQRLAEKSKPATINRELACLKHMYTCALDWEEAKNIKRPTIKTLPEPPGRTRYLSEAEAAALLENLPLFLRLIVFTALNTGLRRSEILTLLWSKVHIDDAINPFLDIVGKGRKQRFVPLNQDMVNLLTSMDRTGDDFVFHGLHNRPLKYFKEIWQRALKKSEITDFRFHDLRHTFASHFLMKGGDLLSLKEILGHSSLKMVERYAHLASGYKLQQVNRLDGTFSIRQPNASKENGGAEVLKKAN
ncbi:MAG TPA: site-specific integrase [Bacteroidales bacterium]|nr:site-specific integrase [Bacteroidales bacterium]